MISAVFKRRLSSSFLKNSPLRRALSIIAWLKAPRQPVGAVGAIFNEKGQVLIVEHVFRTDFPWGLPGGWIEPGEDPSVTVWREAKEELDIEIQVRELLFSGQVGLAPKSTHPKHLGLAYYCTFLSGKYRISSEILSMEWVDPRDLKHEMAPFQLQAVLHGVTAFEREQLRFRAPDSPG